MINMRDSLIVVPILLLSAAFVELNAFTAPSSSSIVSPTTKTSTTTTTTTTFLISKERSIIGNYDARRRRSNPLQKKRPVSYVDSDVSTFLFRDLLKKVRGNDDGEEDENKNEKKNEGEEEEEEGDEEEVVAATEESEALKVETTKEKKDSVEEKKEEDDDEGFLPFFAQVMMGSAAATTEEETKTEPKTPTIEPKKEEIPPPSPSPAPKPTLSPREKALADAQSLRAQAEKARLEAEKMDVVLTLDKISKLESQLNQALAKNDKEKEKEIREQIVALEIKLRGETKDEPNTPVVMKKEATYDADAETTTTFEVATTKDKEETTTPKAKSTITPTLSYEEIQNRVDKFNKSPKFLRQLVAKTADFDFTDVDSINTTALILKLYDDEQQALSYSVTSAERKQAMENVEVDVTSGKPKFTAQQIEEKTKEVSRLPQFVKNLYGEDSNNDTAIALALLEDDYNTAQNKNNGWFSSPSPEKKGEEISGGGGSGLFAELNRRRQDMSELDAMVESLYPKSTRKENEGPSEAQVNQLLSDVLTKKTVPFMPSGKPEAIPGGFLIRGTMNFKSSDYEEGKMPGDDLIVAIDETIEKNAPALKESLSVFYVADPYPQEEELGPGDWPPVLYITGADVWRGPQQILGTLVSSAGLATLWYTAIYPFLLNPTFMKRADEELALADAGMTPDLGWLNELANPLFLGLLGIQIGHEIAHRVVANAYKMEITLPTFVPSLVSGIASSVTTLKAPPKNKQALFDFAIAGPLTGMILSLIALYTGLLLTASTTDASAYANLPSLPVDFLRESALGGGLIDIVLGEGVLDVVATTGVNGISDATLALHPLAIAGFIMLNLNALSLLPFGRTDGGRISLALFGRNGSPPVGLITAFCLFIRGAFGSDLILFYTTFLLFFQGEPEIPLRNEVDEIDFSRVLLATVSGVLVLLTLLPM